MTTLYTLRPVTDQPSTEKLSTGADGSKYRDPQPDNMQGVRDLGMLKPKRNISVEFLPSGVRKLLSSLSIRVRGEGGHEGNKVLWA